MKKLDSFLPCGHCTICNGGGYEIELNNTGEAARFRLFGQKVTRWRSVQFTPSGRAFSILNRRRQYLDNYLKF